MSKIHPLFVAVIDRIKCNMPYFEEFGTWEKADKPVLAQEEPDFGWRWANERHALNERIKELEEQIRMREEALTSQEERVRRLEEIRLGVLTDVEKNWLYNAALDEAARLIDAVPLQGSLLGDRIRGLKR